MQKREPVTFNGNAEILRLQFPSGKRCSHGSILYSLLDDDRALFATRALDQEIQTARPRKGELISITQAGKDQWEVQVVPPVEQPVRTSPEAIPATQPAQGNGDNPNTDGRTKAALMNKLGEVLAGNNGDRPTPKPAPPRLMSGQAQHTLAFYTDAVDLVVAVEKYAAQCGLNIRADFEDIRAIAATSRISAAQNRGSR